MHVICFKRIKSYVINSYVKRIKESLLSKKKKNKRILPPILNFVVQHIIDTMVFYPSN